MMWQPIETAPRNQTFLAVLNCAGEQTICTMRWPVAEAKNSRPDSKTFHVERVTHWMPLPDLPGAQPAPSVPSEEDESVRKAWSRFSNALHRSPDAPYPGMSEAFERHFSQSFTDREWRAESATWAAAWKAAKRHEAQAQPAPSIPVEAIGKMLADVMAVAVSNGANSASMPDEYVEVAAWLCGMPAQNVPSVPDGWIQRGMAELEAIRNRHDDDTPLNDRALIERIGKAMLAAAPEAKP